MPSFLVLPATGVAGASPVCEDCALAAKHRPHSVGM